MIGLNNTTLSSQQLGDINAQVTTARAQKVEAESKARTIRDALRRGVATEVSDVMNSDLLRRLSEQQVALRAQLAEQSSTLLDQHPRIKELRAQISDLDRQIRTEAERTARAFENEAGRAAALLQSLSGMLDQLKKQAASSNAQDVKLRALEREAKSQRDLLESWLAKYREAIARDNVGASSPEARIISRGIVSNTPSWPKKLPTVLVAALAMFTVAVGFTLTGQLMGGASPVSMLVPATVPSADVPVAVRVFEQMIAQAAAAPAAMAPSATPSAPVGASQPKAEASFAAAASEPTDAIEELVLALKLAGDSGRRVAVIGARANMGTTFAAISLARALAKQGRTVLVDLAIDAPQLSSIASDASAPGLRELVQGAASFGQIITRDRYSRVHLITIGKGDLVGDAILTSQRLSIALEALARSYDYVVLDAGALPGIAPEKFAKLVARAVLVTDDIASSATAAARERLQAAGFPNVSVLASIPDDPESDAGRAAA
jgi:Mrp family chromosome partitioning ATPase